MKRTLLVIGLALLAICPRPAQSSAGCGLVFQATTWNAFGGYLELSISNRTYGWHYIDFGSTQIFGLANGDRVNAQWHGISCPHPTFNFASTYYFSGSNQGQSEPIAEGQDTYAEQWEAVVVCPNGYGFISTVGTASCTP